MRVQLYGFINSGRKKTENNMLDKKLALKIFEGFSIQRWTDLVRPFDIVEMDKAAEKMIVAFMLGKAEEKKGRFVDWSWMIYASLFDFLRKISLCDIKAPVQAMLKRDYPVEFTHLNEWVLSQYKPLLGDDELFKMFTIYIGQKNGSIDIPEKTRLTERILSAAHKYASFRELCMLSVVNEPLRIQKITNELKEELQQYLDLSGLQPLMMEQKSFEFLLKVEQLRFQVRWNQTPRVPKTSVMGHCYFVALLTLLLCRLSTVKMNEKRIVNNYFCALFHDLPEAVTRDIISPVKSATIELPNVVKQIEDKIVFDELVPLMDKSFSEELIFFIRDEFSNRGLAPDGEEKELSLDEMGRLMEREGFIVVDGRLVRVADHLSALMEADSSIKHGITSSHLEYGRTGMLNHYKAGELVNGVDAGKLFKEIAGE